MDRLGVENRRVRVPESRRHSDRDVAFLFNERRDRHHAFHVAIVAAALCGMGCRGRAADPTAQNSAGSSGGAPVMGSTGGKGATGDGTAGIQASGTEGTGGIPGSGGLSGTTGASGGGGRSPPDDPPMPIGFHPGVGYPIGRTPAAIAVGDFDGDGALDVAVGTSAGRDQAGSVAIGEVRILMNRGGGALGAPVTYPLAAPVTSLAVADLNGDGRPEVVVASGTDLDVLMNIGSGAFAFMNHPMESRTISVAIGDLDGDGSLDIGVTKVASSFCASGDASALLNRGDGTFAGPLGFGAGARPPQAIAFADMNGDQRLDVVAATDSCASGDVAVLLNEGNRVFGAPINAGRWYFYHPASSPVVGDLNGDGKADVVVAYNGHDSGNGFAEVLLGSGAGAFAGGGRISAGAPTGGTMAGPPGTGPDGLALADFDRDGRLDVVAANSGGTPAAGNISLMLGRGDGTFGDPMSYAVGARFVALAVGDLDGDGRPDVAAADAKSAAVTVFLNDFP